MKHLAEKDLAKHRKQAVDYWVNINPKPDYIILCNFKELWIYEPKEDSDLPRVKIKLNDLPRKYGYLKFFIGEKPVFDEENVELTIKAAKYISKVYWSAIERYKDKLDDLRLFIMQCIFCMFAENSGLLTDKIFLSKWLSV